MRCSPWQGGAVLVPGGMSHLGWISQGRSLLAEHGELPCSFPSAARGRRIRPRFPQQFQPLAHVTLAFPCSNHHQNPAGSPDLHPHPSSAALILSLDLCSQSVLLLLDNIETPNYTNQMGSTPVVMGRNFLLKPSINHGNWGGTSRL